MGLEVSFSSGDFAFRRLRNSASNFETWVSQSRKVSNLLFFQVALIKSNDSERFMEGEGRGWGHWYGLKRS